MIIPIFILASGTPKWLVHTLSSIIGLGLLISFFNTNIIFQIGLTLSAWIMLQISHKIGHGCRGLLSLILCVSFNLICELFFATPVDWQSIRGMVVINRVLHKKQLKVGSITNILTSIRFETNWKLLLQDLQLDMEKHSFISFITIYLIHYDFDFGLSLRTCNFFKSQGFKMPNLVRQSESLWSIAVLFISL